jgi:endoglucanase
MKQIFVTLIFICASLGASLAQVSETIVLKRGLPTDIWLTWPNAERLDEAGLIENFPEYRLEYKGDEFHDAKKAGFDFVRLTIDPAVFIYNRHPEKTVKLISGMKFAIAEIQAAGLNVVVDLHSMPRTSPDPGSFQIMADAKLFQTYLAVVGDIGKSIAGYKPNQVAFEPMNEPTVDCEWDMKTGEKLKWPAMLKQLHAAARSSAPDLTVILSGGCWGGPDGLVALNPNDIADQNVIWSFHNYEPFIFTHQGATWNDGHESYLKGLHFPPQQSQRKAIFAQSKAALRKADVSEARRKELMAAAQGDLTAYFDPGWAIERAKRPFVLVEAWAKKYKIPSYRIFMGEFGAIRETVFTKARQKERAGYYKLIRTEAEKRGYGWSTWSWSGGFGLTMSEKSRVFDPVMLKALGIGK